MQHCQTDIINNTSTHKKVIILSVSIVWSFAWCGYIGTNYKQIVNLRVQPCVNLSCECFGSEKSRCVVSTFQTVYSACSEQYTLSSEDEPRRLPPCPMVIALVPLKCYSHDSRNWQFPHRVPFTKEKMPWCPCLFQKQSIRAWDITLARSLSCLGNRYGFRGRQCLTNLM